MKKVFVCNCRKKKYSSREQEPSPSPRYSKKSSQSRSSQRESNSYRRSYSPSPSRSPNRNSSSYSRASVSVSDFKYSTRSVSGAAAEILSVLWGCSVAAGCALTLKKKKSKNSLHFVVPMGIYVMGNLGRFPQGKPAATESRCPTLTN